MDARKMLQSITLILTYLKWGWEILLHVSFFRPNHAGLLLPDLTAAVAHYRRPRGGRAADEDAECAVCLSKIEEGDEVSELTCQHVFHKVCLDRWSQQYSLLINRRRHPTCPLCRRSLAGAPEVLVFDFAGLVCSDDNRHTWWLR